VYFFVTDGDRDFTWKSVMESLVDAPRLHREVGYWGEIRLVPSGPMTETGGRLKNSVADCLE
jgi:hypothetical protein